LGTGSVTRRVATALPREHLPLDLARQVIEILLEANGVDIPQLHVRAEEPDRVSSCCASCFNRRTLASGLPAR
jgi:hypothetical protein